MTLRITTARGVLAKASEYVAGDRADAHGPAVENHANIAHLWSGYLHDSLKDGVTLTPEDAANLMELLKIARRKQGNFNADDYVDGAGYAGVAFECAYYEDEKRRCNEAGKRDEEES
tara:strand:+ start:1356 stop:1706 length:351 start_codon:yes stop_codon:yes gene_type:complete